jgi:recombination protein RecT
MAEQKKQITENGQTLQAVATIEKNIADNVLRRVQQFTVNKDIRLPADYSPENALKSAWLILLETKTSKQDGGRPVLEVCTKESIANALLNMVLQGLNPVKKQCDFIAYGNKLTMQREYHGTIALAKRYGNIQEPVGNIIYEDDEFEYSIDARGYKKVIKHVQNIDNIDVNKIKGAYATLLFEDPKREPYVEIMTMKQIRQAWMQGATKGDSPAHKNFPDQMAAKTVISRACKLFITSSDDSALFDEPEIDNFTISAKEKIATGANKEEITLDVHAEDVTAKNGNNEQKKKPEKKEKSVKKEPAGRPVINNPEVVPTEIIFAENENLKPGF